MEQYYIDPLPPSDFYLTSLEKPFPFPNILSTSTPPDYKKWNKVLTLMVMKKPYMKP
jgi:hypothetical protein